MATNTRSSFEARELKTVDVSEAPVGLVNEVRLQLEECHMNKLNMQVHTI